MTDVWSPTAPPTLKHPLTYFRPSRLVTSPIAALMSLSQNVQTLVQSCMGFLVNHLPCQDTYDEVITESQNEMEIDAIYTGMVIDKERMRKNFPSGTNPLYYRKIGSGPEIFVLLHGMVATSSFWEIPMMKHLSAAERLRCTFIIPDLAGYGKSLVDPLRNYSVEEQIELVIRDVLIPEGIEFFNLVGHSYGGLVALHLAGAMPSRILQLTLLAPAYFNDPFAFHNFIVGNNAATIVRWVGKLETSPYMIRLMQMAQPLLVVVAGFMPESILPYSVWKDLFETRAHTTIMTILGIRATGDLSLTKTIMKHLSDRNVFITVIHGDEDWVVPLCNSQQLIEDYPRAKLIVLEGVGHQFPVTAARTTFKLLMRDLNNCVVMNG